MSLDLIFEWVLQLHSLWAILTITIIFYTILRSFFSAYLNKIFKPLDLRITLFALIFSHIQFAIGIILYFVSPKFKWWNIFHHLNLGDTKYNIIPIANCMCENISANNVILKSKGLKILFK